MSAVVRKLARVNTDACVFLFVDRICIYSSGFGSGACIVYTVWSYKDQQNAAFRFGITRRFGKFLFLFLLF